MFEERVLSSSIFGLAFGLWCTKVPKLGAFLNLEDTIYVEFCARAT